MTKQEVLDRIPVNISTGFAIKTGDTPIKFTKLPADTWSMSWTIQNGISVSPMSGDINTPFVATYNDRSSIGKLKLKSGDVEIAICIRKDSYSGVTYSGPMNSSSESKIDTAGFNYISVPSSGGWFIVTYNSPDITVNEVDGSDFSLYKYGHASVIGYINGNTGYEEIQKGFSVKVSDTDSVYFTIKVPTRSLSVQPEPLIFEPEGGIKTLTVTTTDLEYTVNWRNKDRFFHEGSDYPSNPGDPVKDGNTVSLYMPETKFTTAGHGILEFHYSDGELAATIEVWQNSVSAYSTESYKRFEAGDSGEWTYILKGLNGSRYSVDGTNPSWVTIDSVTKEPIENSHLSNAIVKGTIKPNLSILDRASTSNYTIWNRAIGPVRYNRPNGYATGNYLDLYQNGAPQHFKLVPNSIQFGSNRSTKSEVTIDTNYTSFTNTNPADWVSEFKYTPNSSGKITITVEANPSETPRSTSVQFKNGNTVLDTLTITQEGQDIIFEVTPLNIDAPKEGGDYTVTVNTNVQYKWKVSNNTTESGDTWFTVQQANAINTIPFKVHVAPNLSAKKYTGTIVFTPTGRASKTVTITSAPSAPKITYTPASSEITKDANTVKVIRKHNLSSISEFENLVGISYTKKELSPYPNAITEYTIKATENTSASDRISFLETSGSGVKATYTLTQRSNIVFNVEQAGNPVRGLHFKKEVSSSSVDVKYNVGWTLSNFASLPFWIKISGAISITNDPDGTRIQTQLIKVAANTGDARTFTLVYTSARGGTIRVIVSQEAGIVPIITVNPTSVELENAEQEFDLVVSATHDWKASNIPDWIQLSSINGSAGITTLRVKVRMNVLLQRSNTLIFSLNKYPNFATCKIVQEGLENGYDITDVEDDSDWGPRQETRIRDKYLKVKVRYTGNEKAIITAIKTLYTLTHV